MSSFFFRAQRRAPSAFQARVANTLVRCQSLVLTLTCLVAVGASSGCFRRSVAVPGVFDLRTDGSGEKSKRPKPLSTERRDFEALLQGKGPYVVGNTIFIEDRAYWVYGAIPAVQGDVVKAFRTVMEASPGGLRNVYVGEQYTFVDWAITFVSRLVFTPAGIITPPLTFQASATALEAPGGFVEGRTAPPKQTPSVPEPRDDAREETAAPPRPEPETPPPPQDPLPPPAGLAPPDELSPDEDLFGDPAGGGK